MGWKHKASDDRASTSVCSVFWAGGTCVAPVWCHSGETKDYDVLTMSELLLVSCCAYYIYGLVARKCDFHLSPQILVIRVSKVTSFWKES